MKKLKDISEFRMPGEVAHDAALKAPNGHKSMLPENLHRLVRTPEFKAWFGDWEKDPENASKVVDRNGEPMVVYHGTPSYGFKEFMNDYKMPRATQNETNNLGMWFTNDKRVAEEFMFKSDKGGVYEVFLNLRNPKVFKPALLNQFEIDTLERNIKDLADEKHTLGWYPADMTHEKRHKFYAIESAMKELYDQIRVLKHSDSFEQFMNYRDKYAEYIDGVKGKIGHWLERMCAMNSRETNKLFLQEMQTNQHDGLAIVDTKYDAPRKNSRVSQYCVFDAKNIKSVENKGRFDTGTTNIYEGRVKNLDDFDI